MNDKRNKLISEIITARLEKYFPEFFWEFDRIDNKNDFEEIVITFKIK